MKNNLRKLQRYISVILLFVCVCSHPSRINKISAATASTVSIKAFNSMIKKVTGKDVLKKKDFKDTSKAITNQQAALLLQRADVMLFGDDYNFELYQNVVNFKRIKDISSASKSYRKPLRMCFIKGIMPGKSDGAYSQTRSLKPTGKVSLSDAKTYVSRLKSKTKRIKLTWDGQVTRTKNLPSNYKSFPYILASFPNSFYEAKMFYQNAVDPTSLVRKQDYYAPVDMNSFVYGDIDFSYLRNRYWSEWKDVVYTNLHCRFNYNYDCSNAVFSKWSQTLAATYQDCGISSRKENFLIKNKNYRIWAKDCKTHIKSSKIVIEPSTMYYDMGKCYVRAYVKFKVDAQKCPTANSGDQNGLIQGDYIYIPEIKNHKWCSAVVDLPIGGCMGDDPGENWRISWTLLATSAK